MWLTVPLRSRRSTRPPLNHPSSRNKNTMNYRRGSGTSSLKKTEPMEIEFHRTWRRDQERVPSYSTPQSTVLSSLDDLKRQPVPEMWVGPSLSSYCYSRAYSKKSQSLCLIERFIRCYRGTGHQQLLQNQITTRSLLLLLLLLLYVLGMEFIKPVLPPPASVCFIRLNRIQLLILLHLFIRFIVPESPFLPFLREALHHQIRYPHLFMSFTAGKWSPPEWISTLLALVPLAAAVWCPIKTVFAKFPSNYSPAIHISTDFQNAITMSPAHTTHTQRERLQWCSRWMGGWLEVKHRRKMPFILQLFNVY